MRLLRRILLGLLVLVLITPTVLLYWIVTTEAGLRFVTGHLGTIGPVTITVADASGTFADGFKVGLLRIQHRRVDIRITNAEGKLRLLPLLRRKIELSSGTAGNVTVQVFHIDGPRTPNALRFMPDTLSVAADALHAGSLDLILMNGHRLHATNISTAAEVLPQVIRIKGAQVSWDDAQMQIAADGRLHATDPLGFDGKASADWRPDGQPAWRFDTAFDGDLDKLPLRVDISRPFHAHADGVAAKLSEHWQLTGNGTTSDLDINVFGGGTALGILSAKVAIVFNENGFSAKGPVIAPGLKAGPIDVDFHGAYANHRLTIRESTAVHRPSGSHGTIHGTVDVVPHGPRLALAGKWTTLQWPLVGTAPAFTSSAGNYSIEGVKPWKAHADGRISAAGLSDLPAAASGILDVDSFTVEDGTIGLYGGTAKVKGEAHWQPAESWNFTGHINGLDVSRLRPDLPGNVDFDFHASGAPFGAAGSIDFALAQLKGKLRGQTAGGSGRFTRAANSDNWQFHDVDLHLGRARIQLDGSLAAPRDLTFALDADDLSLLDESAHGKISAHGRYAGTDAAPVLVLKGHGSAFDWRGYRVDGLDADIDIDLGDNGHAQGKVDLTGIHHDSYTVRQATLDLAGTGKAQHVTLNVDAAPMHALLTAAGTLNNELWRGTIDSLKVNDDQGLSLLLDQPTPLLFDMQRLELGDLCVTSDKARGCVNGKKEADGRWSAAVSVDSMPLRAFTAGLTQDIDYEGTINLKGNVSGGKDTPPTGSLSGELMKAQLLHKLGNGRVEPLSLGSGTMQATATTSGFSAQVSLDAGTAGSITGKLTGERNTSNWMDYPIKGELDARTDGLALLDIYVGGIDKATGQLTTRVDVGGTLGTPALSGQLQLRDASIDVYQVGGALRDVTLDAHFDAHTLDLTGQSRLGNCTSRLSPDCGIAHFNGKLAWRDDEPYGNLHLEGDHLLIVDVPEAHIEASPRLDFELAGHRVKASGEVLIPKAKLEPADLTNTVLASDDERLVDAPVVDPGQRWTVISDIQLKLGDDVNIKSLGLTASLGGSIKVHTDESPNSRGQGELIIKSGKYMAYGRLLDIDRGRLIFNGPLNDPSVDIRAQKTFLDVTGDVTAGVNVRGALRSPRLTFFSEPSLPQSQIASLILAGGSLDSAQNSGRPGAARNELLTQAGALLGQRVGTRIGLDDIGVESDVSDINGDVKSSDTSLVLGKYLSPRLYVSYGISLAEAINTFKMRVTLGKGWTIRTEAGRARSADIVYTIKKGNSDKAQDQKSKPQASPPPAPSPK